MCSAVTRGPRGRSRRTGPPVGAACESSDECDDYDGIVRCVYGDPRARASGSRFSRRPRLASRAPGTRTAPPRSCRAPSARSAPWRIKPPAPESATRRLQRTARAASATCARGTSTALTAAAAPRLSRGTRGPPATSSRSSAICSPATPARAVRATVPATARKAQRVARFDLLALVSCAPGLVCLEPAPGATSSDPSSPVLGTCGKPRAAGHRGD